MNNEPESKLIPESAMKEGKKGRVLFTECLLGARYYVSASPRLPPLILTTILERRYYCFHFISEATEKQVNYMTCLRYLKLSSIKRTETPAGESLNLVL